MKKTSIDPEEYKSFNNKRIIKTFSILLFVFVILWSGFTVYEYIRVKNNQDTLVCLHKVKEQEDNERYSVTCYGIFYKYRKYYYVNSNKLSAREFTMFFNEFKGEE